jgi:hypothetical protein
LGLRLPGQGGVLDGDLEQVRGRHAAVRPPGFGDPHHLVLAGQVVELVAALDGLAERKVTGQHHVCAVERDDQHAVHRPWPDAGDSGETVQDVLVGHPPQRVVAQRASGELGGHGAQRRHFPPGQSGLEQVAGVGGEQRGGGRQPPAEQVLDAAQDARGRPHRQLLPGHHEDQGAERVHWRQLAQPGPRVEAGVRVDNPGEHGVRAPQVGKRRAEIVRLGGVGYGRHPCSLRGSAEGGRHLTAKHSGRPLP